MDSNCIRGKAAFKIFVSNDRIVRKPWITIIFKIQMTIRKEFIRFFEIIDIPALFLKFIIEENPIPFYSALLQE